MTLVLELTEAQQERLRRYAAANGLTEETALLQLVETLPAPPEPSGPLEPLPPRVPGWHPAGTRRAGT